MMITEFRDKIGKWVAIFKSWDKNKQLTVIGLALFLYVYILNANFVIPVRDDNKINSAKIAELKDGIQGLNGQTQAILAEVQNSIANPHSQKALSYKQQLDELDKKLAAYNQQLISAKEMSAMLQDLLKEEKGLSLINITSLPSVDILASANLPPDLKNIPNRATLYKRGAKLIFSGSYFETLEYLKKLENYGKHIFWDDFSYTVEMYPNARVTLTVYTLTSEEGWMGG